MMRSTQKGKRAGSQGRTPQESPSLTHRRERLQRIAFAAAFIVLVGSVTEFRLLSDPTGRYDIDSETVSSHTVQAAFSLDSEDLEATREKREEAAALVPAIYSVDKERISNQLLTLQQRITTLKDRRPEVEQAIRDALLASHSGESVEEIVNRATSAVAVGWKADPLFEGFPDAPYIKVWVQPDLDTVPERIFNEETVPNPAGDGDSVRETKSLVETGGDGMAYANMDALTRLTLEGLKYVLLQGVLQQGSDPGKRVVISRPESMDDLQLKVELDSADLLRPDTARTQLRQRIDVLAAEFGQADPANVVNWDGLVLAAFEMGKNALTDTLVYDQVLTEGERQLARSTVEPVMRRIESNQILQEEGYRWTEQSRQDTRTYWDILDGGAPRTRSVFSPILANMILVGLLLLALSRALPVLIDRKASAYTAISVALLVACATLALGRIVAYFEPSGFLVPLAASAMLLTILTNPRLASMTTLITAVLLSAQYHQDWRLLLVSGAMAFTGIVSLYNVRKRTDMARAAMNATFIGLLAALALTLSSGTLLSWQTIQLFILIALNGTVCLFVVPGLLSPLERLFGITTDIQLLEYSDLNNPLLSRLAIEVPATYAHSLMMGQLAEAAADAIGANGLMARVCAYYHDIGKLRRPEYFSENQTGYNIHDELSPRLSARAIASHVTEGAEIAREHHLPQPIIRGILEHHGTMLISFFYQQALDQQKHGDVREEDFRYPGPKPQSPETAILMICDGVESGVRSIKHPNEDRVREFISKIVQNRAADRQFDECDLTLKKLDIIGDVLTRFMMTTMHARISYPERSASPEAGNVIRMYGSREP